MPSLTMANAVIQISIPGLFTSPQQLQGFAADEVFDNEALESAETLMGVDGKLSGGFVYVPFKWGVSLQSDSESNAVFDQWWQNQQVNQEVLIANGLVLLKALGTKWTMTKGFLTRYKPMPDGKKITQPRKYEITWERVSPSVA